MGSGEQGRLEKLGKLCALLAEHQAKCYEIREEMARIIGGQAGIGEVLKDLETTFDAVWCQRYAIGQTGKYMFQFHRDVPQLKRLVKMIGVEETKRRMVNYLQADDPFYVKNKHAFGIFVSSINQFAEFTRTPADDFVPPVGCKHLPPCRSDQEHTRRRAADARGDQPF